MIGLQPKILLAPASGPGIGGGHVMRNLALAQALAARGAACTFSCGPHGADIVERYGQGQFAGVGASLSRAGAAAFDALILDNYQICSGQETPLRADFPVIMVIDDLADRAHDCDLLLDPGYGRAAADYAHLLPASARTLLGPDYALLRNSFAGLRATALKRTRPDVIERLFINFGLSDVGAVAARAYGALRASLASTRVDLVVASDAQSLPTLREWAQTDANLALHIDCQTVGALMAQADAAIGAGGASTWERACLGLPTLAIVVAENQRPMIERLTADGVLLSVALGADDFEPRLRQAYNRLCDRALRERIAERGTALCDGQGADRAAEALLVSLAVSP
jgi:UDP-2,4-diacetamido-2,4,6-trideoxy-beta-L-altropyranose hydrolase